MHKGITKYNLIHFILPFCLKCLKTTLIIVCTRAQLCIPKINRIDTLYVHNLFTNITPIVFFQMIDKNFVYIFFSIHTYICVNRKNDLDAHFSEELDKLNHIRALGCIFME